MVDIGAGAIQTLIATLQNSNTQSGHMIKAIEALGPPLNTMGTQLNAVAAQAVAAAQNARTLSATPNGVQFGATTEGAPLPAQPDGFITITIPGVGDCLIPYYYPV